MTVFDKTVSNCGRCVILLQQLSPTKRSQWRCDFCFAYNDWVSSHL